MVQDGTHVARASVSDSGDRGIAFERRGIAAGLRRAEVERHGAGD